MFRCSFRFSFFFFGRRRNTGFVYRLVGVLCFIVLFFVLSLSSFFFSSSSSSFFVFVFDLFVYCFVWGACVCLLVFCSFVLFCFALFLLFLFVFVSVCWFVLPVFYLIIFTYIGYCRVKRCSLIVRGFLFKS